MNTLNFYPKKIRKYYQENIIHSGTKISPEIYHNRLVFISLVISIISSLIFYFIKINLAYSLLVFIFMNIFFYFKISISASARIKKMEKVFPDFISLMASNLRSGLTVDRAFLISAREEFNPLDDEIERAGKEIATGKDIKKAFKDMSIRINSEKITKVINLINSGLSSGGNISDLLEQTSSNMKEKEFIEKRAASSILMYVIFIFFAVGIGAPVLFSLSSILVEIVVEISSKIPDVSSAQYTLPLTFSKVNITPDFIIYFSIIFIIVTDLISCLVIGLVNKGEAKTGLKYFIPLAVFSITTFFILRVILAKFLSGALSI